MNQQLIFLLTTTSCTVPARRLHKELLKLGGEYANLYNKQFVSFYLDNTDKTYKINTKLNNITYKIKYIYLF